MTETPSSSSPRGRRAGLFTTTTVVSFSLTLFAGSVAVLAGLIPLRSLSLVERLDIGTMLFVAPVVALVLAIIFETTRIALSRQPLPEPRRQQVIRNWTPGRREG
jgi:hypothetical protein